MYIWYMMCVYIHVYYIYICTCIHRLQKKKRFFRLNIKDNQSVHLVYIKVNTGNDRLKPFSVAGSLFVTLIEIYSFSSYPYIYTCIHIHYNTTQHNIRITTDNIKHEKTKAHLTLVLFVHIWILLLYKNKTYSKLIQCPSDNIHCNMYFFFLNIL